MFSLWLLLNSVLNKYKCIYLCVIMLDVVNIKINEKYRKFRDLIYGRGILLY